MGCADLRPAVDFARILAARRRMRETSRRSFTSARQLTHAIGALIGGWNDPFTWTMDAGTILAGIQRATLKRTFLQPLSYFDLQVEVN
jgi:hypothetical protein